MSRVIVSTSTSCLDYFEKPNNIRMLRMHIYIDKVGYLDGSTITTQQVTQMMNSNRNLLPRSSAPSEEEIINFFYDLIKEGITEALVVCVSSHLSETYRLLLELKSLFARHMTIHVYDSRNISYSEGLLALEAARLLDRGLKIADIIRRLDAMRDNMTVYFALDDLRNMIRTKRISAPAGFIANLLSIKPLLHVNERGEIVPFEKIRHIEKALDRMCEVTVATIAEHQRMGKQSFVYLMSSGGNELSEYVSRRLAAAGIHDVPLVPVATVSVAILGTRGIGIGVLKQD